jgi:hypothetical protein
MITSKKKHIDIQFCIEHPLFLSPFHVWVEWLFPFLPRVGETVDSWLWIESKYMYMENCKKILTKEGDIAFNSSGDDFKDWLATIANEANYVYQVSYFVNEGEVCVFIGLNNVAPL